MCIGLSVRRPEWLNIRFPYKGTCDINRLNEAIMNPSNTYRTPPTSCY
jgi:hypothetical protein